MRMAAMLETLSWNVNANDKSFETPKLQVKASKNGNLCDENEQEWIRCMPAMAYSYD